MKYLKNCAITKGIKKTVRTGNKTCKTEIFEFPYKSSGIRKGISSAITILVSSKEKTTYSTFPFKILVTTGEAIAVGVIAVIKAAVANVSLKGLMATKSAIGKSILTARIIK